MHEAKRRGCHSRVRSQDFSGCPPHLLATWRNVSMLGRWGPQQLNMLWSHIMGPNDYPSNHEVHLGYLILSTGLEGEHSCLRIRDSESPVSRVQSPRPSAFRCLLPCATVHLWWSFPSTGLVGVPRRHAWRRVSDTLRSKKDLSSSNVSCNWHMPGLCKIPFLPFVSPTNMERVVTL